MELILQKELPHQQQAVDAICSAFNGVPVASPALFYTNPIIDIHNELLYENISSIQQGVHPQYRNYVKAGDYLNLDIKMETGTGKTYVYTETIFELHKRYGLNKFIIVVPSLAIKAGTKQFLLDEYVRRHFYDACGYGCDVELGVLEAVTKKKGRFFFPSVVSEFVKGSCQNSTKIYVLLVNMQLLTGGKMLTRDDYDYGVEGFYRPFDALRATRPVVIIDEPHRFDKTQKAFKVITGELQPQFIIRFGATFPETTTGRGNNKITIKDYQNLLYDLNACESFNQNLIKGVAKEHFAPVSQRNEKIKIVTVHSKDSVVLHHKRKDEVTKVFTLKPGDSLSVITDAFEGIKVNAVGTSTVEFSNGLEKKTGEELDVDVYMTSYQEQMMRLALQRHFETEKANFCDRSFKIKTLALFFIDDISSYRQGDDGKEPFLRIAFERLLKERIETEIAALSKHETEYGEFLLVSLADIPACHAGYFSQDNSDTDESIAKEVDDILHKKKQLLSFKNPDGTYNTRRFLFSKWTLKEGWDNPNVFTITKLRSSGSENSKLQEVGRGLRLPVDEYGNRVSNEEFDLNYIVDFTEADFADELVEQINGELPQMNTISSEMLDEVARKYGVDPDDLFVDLLSKKYIDRNRVIRSENSSAFFAEFPELATGLSAGKVKDRNKTRPKPVKIRKAVYNELRELWEIINQRYLLFYDQDLDGEIETAIIDLLEKDVFVDVVMTSIRDVVESDGTLVTVVSDTGVQYTVNRPIAYNEFLKRIAKTTSIPITTMHSAMQIYAQKHGGISPKYINESTLASFCVKFQDWKNNYLQGRFRYVKSNCPRAATALSYADGSPREEIVQGRIGTKISEGTPSAKYLYDIIAYDSPLEKLNIMTEIEEVVVYGKIPRGSIAIPTITGGMYSPDFMYLVKRANGEKELNIIVETKDVENQTELRGTEAIRINCAETFFKMLSNDGYKVHFHKQIGGKMMKQIIEEVLVQ